MRGDLSGFHRRTWSTRFLMGGGDERVAFKFRARHAHRLTVTSHVTDRERRDCRPIIGLSVVKGSTVRVSLGRARSPAGMSPINAQRGAGPRHVTASSSALLLKPGGRRRSEAGRRVTAVHSTNAPATLRRHAPHNSAV